MGYQPSRYLGPYGGDDDTRWFGKGGPGPHSWEGGGVVNLRPFWVEPRALMLHNIYLASETPLVDRSKINANVIGAGAVLSLAFAVGGEKAVAGVIAAWGGLWVLWVLDIPSGLRDMLTQPELREVLQY